MRHLSIYLQLPMKHSILLSIIHDEMVWFKVTHSKQCQDCFRVQPIPNLRRTLLRQLTKSLQKSIDKETKEVRKHVINNEHLKTPFSKGGVNEKMFHIIFVSLSRELPLRAKLNSSRCISERINRGQNKTKNLLWCTRTVNDYRTQTVLAMFAELQDGVLWSIVNSSVFAFWFFDLHIVLNSTRWMNFVSVESIKQGTTDKVSNLFSGSISWPLHMVALKTMTFRDNYLFKAVKWKVAL